MSIVQEEPGTRHSPNVAQVTSLHYVETVKEPVRAQRYQPGKGREEHHLNLVRIRLSRLAPRFPVLQMPLVLASQTHELRHFLLIFHSLSFRQLGQGQASPQNRSSSNLCSPSRHMELHGRRPPRTLVYRIIQGLHLQQILQIQIAETYREGKKVRARPPPPFFSDASTLHTPREFQKSKLPSLPPSGAKLEVKWLQLLSLRCSSSEKRS